MKSNRNNRNISGSLISNILFIFLILSSITSTILPVSCCEREFLKCLTKQHSTDFSKSMAACSGNYKKCIKSEEDQEKGKQDLWNCKNRCNDQSVQCFRNVSLEICSKDILQNCNFQCSVNSKYNWGETTDF